MGEGGGRSTKKIFAQGKIKWKKIHARQLILKKYSCYGLKKIHTRNLITKKFLRLENSPPPPPHNFSNGPSLNTFRTRTTNQALKETGEIMLAVTKTLSLFRWSLLGGYVKPLVLSPLSLHITWKWTLIKNRWHSSKLLVGNVGPGVVVSLTRAVIGLGGRGEIKQGLNGLHSGPLNFDVRSPGGGGGGYCHIWAI